MVSSPLLSSLTPTNIKSFRFSQLQHLPISKVRILRRGFGSKPFLGGRVGRSRVFEHKNRTEFVRIDAVRGGGGSEEEAEMIFGGEFREFESNLNRMSKWLVAALFGIVILWKHDAEALWAAMGSVVNSGLSVTLKQVLNHERPASALRSDPGMPSSHAQSIFYTAFFAVLSLFSWLGMNAFTVGIGTTIILCSSYLTWLRVSQRLHTVSQIVVGAILGSACSITWFWMWHSFVERAFLASIWVRLIVVLSSVLVCSVFLLYVIHYWLKDED